MKTPQPPRHDSFWGEFGVGTVKNFQRIHGHRTSTTWLGSSHDSKKRKKRILISTTSDRSSRSHRQTVLPAKKRENKEKRKRSKTKQKERKSGKQKGKQECLVTNLSCLKQKSKQRLVVVLKPIYLHTPHSSCQILPIHIGTFYIHIIKKKIFSAMCTYPSISIYQSYQSTICSTSHSFHQRNNYHPEAITTLEIQEIPSRVHHSNSNESYHQTVCSTNLNHCSNYFNYSSFQ